MSESFYSALLKFNPKLTIEEQRAIRKQLKAKGFDHQKPFYFTDGNKEQEARAKRACENHCAKFQSPEGIYWFDIGPGFWL